jgi:GNAT superfamily N-acetyltransferase
MYLLKRTNSDDLDFQSLVVELDKDLAIRDGEDHSFFAQFNKIASIKHVVVAYQEGNAVGCGAIKEYESDLVNEKIMEVKRMFVPLEIRGNGIASIVLKELESWAKELGYQKCILETGLKQPEAIALYKKNNYNLIQNYGQYAEVKSSVCFEKVLYLS